MKKLLVLFMVAVLLFLCACDDETTKQEEKTSTTTTTTTTAASTTIPSQRVEHIAQKLENGMLENLNEYNEEEKEQIKQAVEKDGYTLEFKEDGSGVLSNEEGEWTVAAGWVENEYTQGVPKVDFGAVTMSVEDEDDDGKYYMFLIRQAKFKEVENYIEQLELAGFNDIADKVLNEAGKMIVFNAKNPSGKLVSIGYSSNGFTIKLTK